MNGIRSVLLFYLLMSYEYVMFLYTCNVTFYSYRNLSTMDLVFRILVCFINV